jgi:hypothetical protein
MSYDNWKLASPEDEERGGYWDDYGCYHTAEDAEQEAAEAAADAACDDR